MHQGKLTLLSLPVEVVGLILQACDDDPDDDPLDFVELRRVCHVFDDIISRSLAIEVLTTDYSWLSITDPWDQFAWSAESIVWLLRTTTLMHVPLNDGSPGLDNTNILTLIRTAANALDQFIPQRAQQVKYHRMRELIGYVCFAVVINIRPKDLLSILNSKPCSLRLGRASSKQDSPVKINPSELLPLLVIANHRLPLQSTIEDLLTSGNEDIDINYQSQLFGNALYAAATLGQCKIISCLISHGAHVNQTGGRWHTPLRASMESWGTVDTLTLLLEKGALLNLQGGELRRTAVMSAVHARNYTEAEFLFDQPDLDVTLIDDAEQSIVHYFCRYGKHRCLESLARRQQILDVNKRSYFGTPMHVTLDSDLTWLNRGHGRVVKFLLRHGADLNIVDVAGKTPIARAKEIATKAERDHESCPISSRMLLSFAFVWDTFWEQLNDPNEESG
ncbi:hypothetical protein FQN49_000386 [Arthroderma sp. PD_2]|nr:hypothetical protein FQN49_000386 [Arthroderma sp. PD_2]